MRPRTILIAIAFSLSFLPVSSAALTVGQFVSICDAYQGDCGDSPFVQAYVGGALDLVAMLDEETDYLDDVYCRDPSEFFDAPKIIRYILANQEGNTDKNAMMLLIRYLEEKGGCKRR